MIGRLTGILLENKAPFLLLDVNGVGYEVQAPMTSCFNMPAIGKQVTLQTHFVVREDAQLLFGFLDNSDRELFRTLIKVSGVGPKMALAILSGMGANQFAAMVHAGDVAALVKIPGVGKKTAERLIVEMKDRLKAPVEGVLSEKISAHAPNARMDAEQALLALGYKSAEAQRMVKAVYKDEMTSQELIRESLKSMVLS